MFMKTELDIRILIKVCNRKQTFLSEAACLESGKQTDSGFHTGSGLRITLGSVPSHETLCCRGSRQHRRETGVYPAKQEPVAPHSLPHPPLPPSVFFSP